MRRSSKLHEDIWTRTKTETADTGLIYHNLVLAGGCGAKICRWSKMGPFEHFTYLPLSFCMQPTSIAYMQDDGYQGLGPC